MEAIPADAGRGVFPWNCEPLRQGGLAPMEGRIKANNLRDMGCGGKNSTDRRQVMRLMKRSQRNKCRQFVEKLGIDPLRRIILGPSMHHPMADTFDPATCYQASRCLQDGVCRTGMIEVVRRPLLLRYDSAVRIRDFQPGHDPDAGDLTTERLLRITGNTIDCKLDAG